MNWKSDNLHSNIGFSVKHMMITNVHGSFGEFNAHIEANDDDFSQATFHFSAAIDSISTGVQDRDAHLKSGDFFNAEQFPNLQFDSSSVEKIDEETFHIHGNLTIKDQTHPISFTAEYGGIVLDPYGQTKTGFSITGKLKRSDYGLTWSAVTEAGKIVVADDIKLNAEIQFIKQN
jgi:polyisoprenoid-binding protein YceI